MFHPNKLEDHLEDMAGLEEKTLPSLFCQIFSKIRTNSLLQHNLF